jgi:hypothetical protein
MISSHGTLTSYDCNDMYYGCTQVSAIEYKAWFEWDPQTYWEEILTMSSHTIANDDDDNEVIETVENEPPIQRKYSKDLYPCSPLLYWMKAIWYN